MCDKYNKPDQITSQQIIVCSTLRIWNFFFPQLQEKTIVVKIFFTLHENQ